MQRVLFSVCLFLMSMSCFGQSNHSELHAMPEPQVMATSNKSSQLSYLCPMHTHIVQDHPGTCPICGMDLVQRQQEKSTEISLSVSGAMQQAMALTTAVAQVSPIRRMKQAYGTIQFNETQVSHIHTRAAGWIEKLTVNSQGQSVKQGDLLYEIYSPQLLVAQEDFLSLLASNHPNAVLIERGRRRLQLLGFTATLIKQLEQHKDVFYRVPYYAAHDGVVSTLNIRQGMYINPEDSLMTIANLATVWVQGEVFQSHMDWLDIGRLVEVDIPALGLSQLTGRIEFVYPILNAQTRTTTFRLTLDNPELQLKPDMFASLRIYATPSEVLNIPQQALIQTAQHNRVFVQLDDTSFVLRDVEVGIISHGKAAITAGLAQGERVVTSGQFLLDAEANLSNVPMVNTPSDEHSHHHH